MSHHSQQPFLGLQAINQCFVLLTQHEELIFQLELPLRPAAIQLCRLEAESEPADNFVLLPAGQPPSQLLENAGTGKDLLWKRLKLDERWCYNKAMKFQQLGLLHRISDLKCHVKATVLMFQKLDQGTQITA